MKIKYFSWKNEFRQWIGDLEPHINVYLFNADDVAKKDRVQFLRRVSCNSFLEIRSQVTADSGKRSDSDTVFLLPFSGRNRRVRFELKLHTFVLFSGMNVVVF